MSPRLLSGSSMVPGQGRDASKQAGMMAQAVTSRSVHYSCTSLRCATRPCGTEDRHQHQLAFCASFRNARLVHLLLIRNPSVHRDSGTHDCPTLSADERCANIMLYQHHCTTTAALLSQYLLFTHRLHLLFLCTCMLVYVLQARLRDGLAYLFGCVRG